MTVEVILNSKSFNLASTLSMGATTLTPPSYVGYPSGAFQSRLLIGSEIIIVDFSTTPWTITRGAESTTAASHISGSVAQFVVTGGGVASVVTTTALVNPMTTRGDIITEQSGPADGRLALGTAGQRLKSDGTDVNWGDDIVDVSYIIGDGSGVPSTGSKGYLQMNQALTIVANTILGDQSGSCVIDVKKSSYSGFPTTSSIVASAPPTVSSALKSTDSTLTGWTTGISAGDVLEFSLTSVTSFHRIVLNLKCKKAA